MASPPLFLLFSVAVAAAASLLLTNVCGLGINYGQIGDNLPHPNAVVSLTNSIGATRIKLYDADPHILKAFANTAVEFVVGLGNEYLTAMTDSNTALSWIKSNVQCYLPATKITAIAVGNEVLTFNDSSLSAHLLPAMENLHAALVSLDLHRQVTVTTTHNLRLLAISYPPSAAVFRRDLGQELACVVDFLCKIGSPFLINAYPFFAYKANPKQIPLDFVLFEGSGIVDSGSGLRYENMLYAQIDAVHSAMEKLGFPNVKVQVSETGWPSMGDSDEAGATTENARRYNGNLLRVLKEKGTPMRPNSSLNVYLFALFNENKKPGPTSERNFGLFKPDGTPVYDLGFNVNGLGNGDSGGGTTPAVTLPAGSPPNGYLPVDDAGRLPLPMLCLIIPIIMMMKV